MEFIDSYVPKDVHLHFIGHSIGAKIVLNLVNRLSSQQQAKGYLLFPTVERMAQSPNGNREFLHRTIHQYMYICKAAYECNREKIVAHNWTF